METLFIVRATILAASPGAWLFPLRLFPGNDAFDLHVKWRESSQNSVKLKAGLEFPAARPHIAPYVSLPEVLAMRFRLVAVLAFAAALLSGCGYNQIQINDEAVSAAWSEVLN